MTDRVSSTVVTKTEFARDRMSRAIRNFIIKLDDQPGWREWKQSSISNTLHFDDELMPSENMADEFKFSEEIAAEHAVVT
jgi:hypothetical protein